MPRCPYQFPNGFTCNAPCPADALYCSPRHAELASKRGKKHRTHSRKGMAYKSKARCVCGLLASECDGHVFIDLETPRTERPTRW